MSSQAYEYPDPEEAAQGLSTPYQSAPAAGNQAQHHHQEPTGPRQQPTAGPAAAASSTTSAAAGLALAEEFTELDPELMDSQQKWAVENGVVIVQRKTTTKSREAIVALRAQRPHLDWHYQGEGVFYGWPKSAGKGEKEEVLADFESQFDLEMERVMKGRQT
ncbi:MAG: hypothetical protein LQ352_007690 [Teloschistes flavicans]|nr:MAG: hypothetical protein LQ352_007690 [Teloschistes flavicans]